jgi:hypothetical protein
MSSGQRKLLDICEQLPEEKRLELVDFAEFLLAQTHSQATNSSAMDAWLKRASGAAKPGTRTDQIMQQTRGEA